MQGRNWRMRLEDILQAMNRIASYVEGMTFEQFCDDTRTIDAVIRNLEIIGEAARYIGDDIESAYPEIPWGSMRAIRNILIHEYFGVDLSIIWQTANQNLPPLEPMLQQILDTHENGTE